MTVNTERGVLASPAARAFGRGSEQAETVEQISRADLLVVRGKDARAVTPLESHAQFQPARSRDPVGPLLEQELVPVRQGRMLVSA